MKSQKPYLTDYNLLQDNSKILSIIWVNEFMKVGVNVVTIGKNVKLAELNTRIVNVFFNIQTLKII